MYYVYVNFGTNNIAVPSFEKHMKLFNSFTPNVRYK